MPFSRPTLTEIRDRVIADIEARVPGADARVRRSTIGVLAYALAAAVHGLYGFLDWLSRQVFPDSAETEYLERWAAIWGITRKSASYAQGIARFTGTDGAIIPAGTVLQRADGIEFSTLTEGTIASGVLDATVEASSAGSAGTLTPGTSLTLVSPIGSVNAAAVAQAGGITGVDEETDAELRARILARIQEPPHGGAAHDYVAWALAVAGVTRAWVRPLEFGIGTVGVTFVRDGDGAGVSIIPDAPEVAEVQAAIDAVRPVTADVTVYAPTSALDAFTIVLTPSSAAVRAAVEAELADLYLREAEPGATILISHVREAVSRAAGETDNAVTSPAGNITHTAHQMPILGTITWA